MPGRTPYKIETDDPKEYKYQLNVIFSMLSDRLDQMEGLRGNPRFYDTMLTESNIVVLDHKKGLVLSDGGNPPHFWRLGVNRTSTTGTLTITDLGVNYG
jgi:hypothetical protein